MHVLISCKNEDYSIKYEEYRDRLRKSTPKFIIHAEFGRYPLSITIKQRMMNYWIRILNGKASKFSYQLYPYMYATCMPQILTTMNRYLGGLKQILPIFNEAGRPDLWLKQFDPIPFSTSKVIKKTLLTNFSKTSIAYYRIFRKEKTMHFSKITLPTQKNISPCLNDNLAKIMLQFRTGNHKLPVEVGRWHKIELSDRKCQLCHASSIGDEFHYILLSKPKDSLWSVSTNINALRLAS